MKLAYTAFLLVFCIPLIAQDSQLVPVQGNPTLRSYVAQKEAKKQALVDELTGYKMGKENVVRVMGDCPPETPFGLNLVEAGSVITITLDTFGLLTNGPDTTFTILTDPAPQFGTPTILDNTIILEYAANADVGTLSEETILVELSQGNEKDTIATTFTVKRKGSTETLPNQILEAEEVRVFCLDGFMNFDSPLACTELVECIDDYPGEGDQFFYLSSFPGVDTCVIYEASRFPGVDTVCVMVCDELGVCDELKIPFEITGEAIQIDPSTQLFLFEDFTTSDGPYPSVDIWLDRDVYVNSTLAFGPPSIGFATFDGLNRRGQPYDIVNVAIADQLTSLPIDMSGVVPSNDISLRYFLAPKGYGQEPEVQDTFKVEFLNDQGNWIEMQAHVGGDVSIDSVPPFRIYGIAINDPQFTHEAFQFRFTAKASPGGYGDWWHLDDIILGEFTFDNVQIDDLAFSMKPNSILKNYESLPFKHFKGFLDTELATAEDSVQYYVFHHFDDQPRDFSNSKVSFLETTTGTDLGTAFELGNQSGIPPDSVLFISVPYVSSSINELKSDIEGIADGEVRNIQATYSFNPTDPADISSNTDTVRINSLFSNYFAYDDGTAELAYFIPFVQSFEQVAQRYRANVSDTMHAVQIMFPHFTLDDFESQLFNMKIWVDDDGDGELISDEIVYERELLQPFFADAVYDTLQGFTTYILEDLLGNATPVAIPGGKDFYVGWQYASDAAFSFPVGFDVQNDCNCIYENLDGSGFVLEAEKLDGSLMVRPVMKSVPFNTSSGTSDIAQTKLPLEVYPNPTNGILNLAIEDGKQLEDFKILVFNQLGQLVAQPNGQAQVDLIGLESGIYFLQISDLRTGGHFVKRIIFEQ